MRFQANSPQVISETIQGETIVIHLGTGAYYSLQGSAAEIWDAIAQAASVEEIAAELAGRHGIDAAQAEAAARSLVDELLAEDLIAQSDAAERLPALGGADVAGPFEAPRLAKFTDMQDLVLLDPVHEVSDAGWPQTTSA